MKALKPFNQSFALQGEGLKRAGIIFIVNLRST